MNNELKNKLDKINASFNKLCDSLNVKFDKDIVEVSLAQFLLNVSVAIHRNIWVPQEDISKIEEYLNFKITFNNENRTLALLKKQSASVPFIFYFMDYIYEMDFESYDVENYKAILSLFSSIALDINNNFKDVNNKYVNNFDVKIYNEYIDIIKTHIGITPKPKSIEEVVPNLQEFCKYVNDIIAGKYQTENEEEKEKNEENKIDVESILNELNTYTGLSKVKEEVSELVNLIQMRKKREANGLKNPQMTYHLCFMGNPGTGKTTVARIIANLYKALGIVKKGHLVEVSRQDLVGEYVGQTAPKTKKVIKKAYGGILFIDEAYSLSNKGNVHDYGQEAIEVLLKEMEDNRDKLIVIVAGYDDLMKDFLSSNPGLESRFNTFIHFEDYDANELVKIIDAISLKNDYVINEDCKKYLQEKFEQVCVKKDKDFANARYARNLFENAIKNQASRVAKLSDDIEVEKLKELTIEDFKDEI